MASGRPNAGPVSDYEEKVWGRTRELICGTHYSLHELRVVAGGYCSLHYHGGRANKFIIADAEIEYTGRGDVSDTQRRGWLGRTISKLWPF